MALSLTQTKSQGAIANAALDLTTCEVDGGSSECNRQLPISGNEPSVVSALQANSLHGTEVPGPLTWSELCARLGTSPVMAAFNAAGLNGHVVFVVDFAPGEDQQMLLINDPRSNPTHSAWKSYSELFRGLGLGLGFWSSTLHSIV